MIELCMQIAKRGINHNTTIVIFDCTHSGRFRYTYILCQRANDSLVLLTIPQTRPGAMYINEFQPCAPLNRNVQPSYLVEQPNPSIIPLGHLTRTSIFVSIAAPETKGMRHWGVIRPDQPSLRAFLLLTPPNLIIVESVTLETRLRTCFPSLPSSTFVKASRPGPNPRKMSSICRMLGSRPFSWIWPKIWDDNW